MKIFSVTNQKGGVGKTTTTANLGAGLAIKGYDVLLIDLDIQGNLTQTFIGDIGDSTNICEILLSESKVDKIVRPTKLKRLDIVPAGETLATADINISSMLGREYLLKNALNSEKVKKYDFVFVDNPPYLSLLTINSLAVSDFIIVPVSCEYLPLVGLKQLLKTIDRIKAKINPKVELFGLLLTMYDKREAITIQVEEILRERFGKDVFNTLIRINTRAKAAPSASETIFEFENFSGRGSEDFSNLTIEFIDRLNNG